MEEIQDIKKARKLERNPRHKGVKPKILRNYLTLTNINIVVLTNKFQVRKKVILNAFYTIVTDSLHTSINSTINIFLEVINK